MGIKTDIIRYNLHDRQRKHFGVDRHFNITKLMKIINSAAVQEMVKKRDLMGYLGHDVRREFGLQPPEMALNGTQFIPIEPAFVTTHVRMFDDGTIEHQAQFLDTPLGKKAQEWHMAKMGGFSSVIAPTEQNPTDFYGFDYVLSPNFHGNRGYAVMDSTRYEQELNRLTSKQKLHEIQARQMEQRAVMDALFQAARNVPELAKQNAQLVATIESLSAQIDDIARERDDFQAAYDELKPKFAPMTRLNAQDNWLQQSLSVMDNIHQAKVEENQNYDVNFQDTLAYLQERQHG